MLMLTGCDWWGAERCLDLVVRGCVHGRRAALFKGLGHGTRVRRTPVIGSRRLSHGRRRWGRQSHVRPGVKHLNVSLRHNTNATGTIAYLYSDKQVHTPVQRTQK